MQLLCKMSRWVPCLILMVALPAEAFLSPEHEWVSNRALCVVESYVERKSDAGGRAKDALEILRMFQGAEGRASYGELVSYPDYSARPDQIIDTSKTGAERINSEHVKKQLDSITTGVGEVRRNSHHFRRKALRVFHSEHERAVSIAALTAMTRDPTDRLVDALALNAYADHFLEDALAPGHMTDEADDRSHMQNNRAHDIGNHGGRQFEVARDTWDDLLGILPPNEQPHAQKGGSTSLEDGRTMVLAHCFSGHEGLGQVGLHGPELIDMIGDGELYGKKSGINPEHVDQALLMVLAVARSIRDVIDSYIDAKPVNSYANRECLSPGQIHPDGACFFDGPESAPRSWGPPASFAGFALGRFRSQARPWHEPLHWPEFAMNFELQRLNSTSRVMMSPEFRFNLPLQAKPLALSWGMGYSYVGFVSGYDGHGPDLRMYADLKSWSTFLAAEAGYRFYDRNGRSESAPRFAGKLGFGNGVLSAYFAVSYETELTRSGKRSDFSTFGLGVSAAFSLTEFRDFVAERR